MQDVLNPVPQIKDDEIHGQADKFEETADRSLEILMMEAKDT